MAQLGHMDRQTSLDYVHIQQRALERAKQLIEAEQAEILASTRAREQKQRPRENGASRLRLRRGRVALSDPPPTTNSQIEAQEGAQTAALAINPAPF